MEGSGLVTTVTVESAEEIAALVREGSAVFSHRTGLRPHGYLCEPSREGFEVVSKSIRDGIQIDTANQVAVADAGLPLVYLQKRLFEEEHCLPFPAWDDDENVNFRFIDGHVSYLTIGEAIGMNFPHAAEAEHGNWRDWIVGMTVVLGDGTIAKSGSQAVKNVAGYDAHKLFIGARGTLGIITQVIVRIKPRSSMSKPSVVFGPYRGTPPHLIQRVLPSDFEVALADAGEDLIAGDPGTGTIWRKQRELPIRRFNHDWIWRSNGEWEVTNFHRHYLERAKRLLDPDGKLNPGLMGIF